VSLVKLLLDVAVDRLHFELLGLQLYNRNDNVEVSLLLSPTFQAHSEVFFTRVEHSHLQRSFGSLRVKASLKVNQVNNLVCS
jgi:hypothetical protein